MLQCKETLKRRAGRYIYYHLKYHPFIQGSNPKTYPTQHHGNTETLSHKNTSISEVHEEPEQNIPPMHIFNLPRLPNQGVGGRLGGVHNNLQKYPISTKNTNNGRFLRLFLIFSKKNFFKELGSFALLFSASECFF